MSLNVSGYAITKQTILKTLYCIGSEHPIHLSRWNFHLPIKRSEFHFKV